MTELNLAFAEHFADLPDPRIDRTKKHRLIDILAIKAKARKMGAWVRGHWGVENGLHWVLDVAFGEDDNKTRSGHAGANLGLVRRVALSLLRQDPAKGSVKAKRLSAALDENYLMKVLQGFPEN